MDAKIREFSWVDYSGLGFRISLGIWVFRHFHAFVRLDIPCWLLGVPAPYFRRYQPSISHTLTNYNAMVNRIVRWASNINQGKEDIGQKRIKAEFIEGGSIGPVSGN
jgi:hypothetical protein